MSVWQADAELSAAQAADLLNEALEQCASEISKMIKRQTVTLTRSPYYTGDLVACFDAIVSQVKTNNTDSLAKARDQFAKLAGTSVDLDEVSIPFSKTLVGPVLSVSALHWAFMSLHQLQVMQVSSPPFTSRLPVGLAKLLALNLDHTVTVNAAWQHLLHPQKELVRRHKSGCLLV